MVAERWMLTHRLASVTAEVVHEEPEEWGFFQVFHASITLDPHQSLTFSVTPQLGWRMLRGGIFELQPQRWEDFSHRKRLSGRHISRCEGPQGRQLGVVLEEHAGGWRGCERTAAWVGAVERSQIMQGLCSTARHLGFLSALWKQ